MVSIDRKYLVTGSLLAVGIVHLLPASGVLGVESVAALYGVAIVDSNLSLLMRHRAVLFGLVGLFCVYAAFRPSLQLIALIGAGVSVAAFLVLGLAADDLNPQLLRVLLVDAVAAVLLIAGLAAYFAGPPGFAFPRKQT